MHMCAAGPYQELFEHSEHAEMHGLSFCFKGLWKHKRKHANKQPAMWVSAGVRVRACMCGRACVNRAHTPRLSGDVPSGQKIWWRSALRSPRSHLRSTRASKSTEVSGTRGAVCSCCCCWCCLSCCCWCCCSRERQCGVEPGTRTKSHKGRETDRQTHTQTQSKQRHKDCVLTCWRMAQNKPAEGNGILSCGQSNPPFDTQQNSNSTPCSQRIASVSCPVG